MKIRILANELKAGEIDFVSLVKHGANRTPFKIIKNVEKAEQNLWAGLIPELQALEKRLSQAPVKKTEKQMSNEQVERRQADQIRKQELAKVTNKLDGLYRQYFNWVERSHDPLYVKMEQSLAMEIEKAEAERRDMTDDSAEMNKRSAFFRRGGTSTRSAATLSDSAYERPAAVQKAEATIDLRDQATLQTDPEEVAKVDLDSGFKI